MRVKVPQQSSGWIALSHAGSDAVRLKVDDNGYIDAPDDLVDILLRAVPGSEVIPAGNPSPNEEATQ